jgi:hypothetical protein
MPFSPAESPVVYAGSDGLLAASLRTSCSLWARRGIYRQRTFDSTTRTTRFPVLQTSTILKKFTRLSGAVVHLEHRREVPVESSTRRPIGHRSFGITLYGSVLNRGVFARPRVVLFNMRAISRRCDTCRQNLVIGSIERNLSLFGTDRCSG